MQKRFRTYLFYLSIAFMLWVIAGELAELNTPLEEFVKVQGTIDTTIEITTTHLRSNVKDRELRIFLNGRSEYYRFMDVYRYETFSAAIRRSDSVEIYVRPAWLYRLSFGNKNDIYEMTLNGKKVFELSQTRRNSRGIVFICIISLSVFSIVGTSIYLYRRRQLKPH